MFTIGESRIVVYNVQCTCRLKKSKAIPVTGRRVPYGCATSRLSHFLDRLLTDGGEVVSLTNRPPFTPGRFLVLISVRG
jgi:hypothetical protein